MASYPLLFSSFHRCIAKHSFVLFPLFADSIVRGQVPNYIRSIIRLSST